MSPLDKVSEYLESAYAAYPGCRILLQVPKPIWDACLVELRKNGSPRCLLDYKREHFVWRDEIIAHGPTWLSCGMQP
jgi:hypothetical protein